MYTVSYVGKNAPENLIRRSLRGAVSMATLEVGLFKKADRATIWQGEPGSGTIVGVVEPDGAFRPIY